MDFEIHPVSTAPNNGPAPDNLFEYGPVTSVPITLPKVTQRGAINAALGLCPRECHRLHIARCPVCTHLDAALRELG